jgi:hypothetical protein
VFTFADGSSWQSGLLKKPSRSGANAEAAQFNALAASSQPVDGASSGSAGESAKDAKGVAAELESLAALHESGALDDEEFRAAKARIIHGGSLP